MRTFETFIAALQQKIPVDHQERERLATLWPAAAESAEYLEANIPPVPWLSPRRRRDIFLRICEQVDAWQDENIINDEQAQLVLTLLRARHWGYRRAESSFVGWAKTEPPAMVEHLPLTARQLMLGVNFRRGQRSSSA